MDKIVAQSFIKFSLRHLFTTRHDGISSNPYNFNNLGLHVGDKKEDVLHNRKVLLKEVGAKHLVSMNQVHSNKVEVIEKEFDKVLECDALITHKKEVALMVMVADCTPVLMYDDINHVIAALHVGRAGAFSNIVHETIIKMQQMYHSNTKNIHVVLGVAIQKCCYEVNEAIALEAQKLGYDFAIDREKQNPHLDIEKIIMHQLLTCNITKTNIETLPNCSSCENDRFFSYRADNQRTGRMCAVIALT